MLDQNERTPSVTQAAGDDMIVAGPEVAFSKWLIIAAFLVLLGGAVFGFVTPVEDVVSVRGHLAESATDTWLATVKVPESIAKSLEMGMPARLRLDDHPATRRMPLHGRVRDVSESVDAESRFTVRIEITAPDEDAALPLIDGQFLSAEIVVGRQSLVAYLSSAR